MEYKTPEKDSDDVLDDSNITQTIDVIKELTGKEFEINIETEAELIDFIDNPEKYIDDIELSQKISELKKLIIQMGDVYYA